MCALIYLIIITKTGKDYKFSFHFVFKSRFLILCQPIMADSNINDDDDCDGDNGVKSVFYINLSNLVTK